jgi:hypothetical protein
MSDDVTQSIKEKHNKIIKQEKRDQQHTLDLINKLNQRNPERIDKTRIKVINIANTAKINKNTLIKFLTLLITAEVLPKFLTLLYN